ncbi:MAG: 4'-phosphopantetheinyl transferase superfamily protein [Bacteroidales bacterium]|nr:4'-phosphopantetheinyl transferase superfamily protein [Bacteroidales bacterium]MCL2133201.1 4'-phosphopantetheinyl transferase superfamily protein [Bacteroidales bacterium]
MPVIHIAQQGKGSIIAVWKITETEEFFTQHHDCRLDEYQHIAHPQRRLERLAVMALLSSMIKSKVCLRHHDNGRPYLDNSKANISITHSKGFAAVIYNENEAVGIDMESLSRDFSAVERKALSDKERAYLSDECRNLQLCMLWCAKEAIYKCVSEEGIDFAQQIFIEEFTPKTKGILTALYTNNDRSVTKFKLRYQTIDDHILVYNEL